jgi:hypothetical protein
MRIVITGRAAVYSDESEHLPSHPDAVPVTDKKALRALHGYDAEEDDLADDLDGSLIRAGVTGGTLKFSYDANRGELRAVTEYRCKRPLTKDELMQLARETVGAWSDGVGEDGFEATWPGGSGRVYPNPPGYPSGDVDRDLQVAQLGD